jgi:TrmH family RNA methyltransferase
MVLDGSADPFSWKALRGAMGSTFHLPVADVTDSAAAIRRAHARGASVLAAVPRGGISFHAVDLTKTRVILIGGEGGGLSSEIIDMVDDRISIPMKHDVESLNAAVAASLIVYEARRQRMIAPSQQLSGHTS